MNKFKLEKDLSYSRAKGLIEKDLYKMPLAPKLAQYFRSRLKKKPTVLFPNISATRHYWFNTWKCVLPTFLATITNAH